MGTRTKTQPAPPRAVFQALVDPHRDPARPWLALLHDEGEAGWSEAGVDGL